MTEQDTKRKWQEDPGASEIFANAREKARDHQPRFCSAAVVNRQPGRPRLPCDRDQ